ncbi:MAG: polysaccharide biosynthesis/export family protein, partial [Candidatus Binatia bacterium]
MTIPFWLRTTVVAILAAGCGPSITVPRLAPAEVSRVAAQANTDETVYRVTPGDKIDVRYTFHPEMSQQEVVRPDGRIRANGVGEIAIAGISTADVAALLVARTRDRLRDPQIVVSILEYAPRTVYVAGEVGRPGPIPYRRGLTPVQAIAQAGGLRTTALAESVVLVRPTGTEGRTISRTLDVESVMKGGAREPLFLAPHDVVFVPRTGIAEANVWMDQHFTQLFPFFRGAGGSMSLG